MKEVKRYIIYAELSDGDEIVLAGEEEVVIACPCGKVILVEHWDAAAFDSLDDLIKYLTEKMGHVLALEGISIKKVRVKRW